MAKKQTAPSTKPTITIKPFVDQAGRPIGKGDQQRIFWHGSHVAYCGTKPNMPINFLAGKNCLLNESERADVLAAVIAQLGSVKITPQSKSLFDVLEEREKAGGDGKPPGPAD